MIFWHHIDSICLQQGMKNEPCNLSKNCVNSIGRPWESTFIVKGWLGQPYYCSLQYNGFENLLVSEFWCNLNTIIYTHRVPRTFHNIQPKLQTDLLISQIYTRIYWLPLYHLRLNISQTVVQKIRYILIKNWLFASFDCQVNSPVVYFCYRDIRDHKTGDVSWL